MLGEGGGGVQGGWGRQMLIITLLGPGASPQSRSDPNTPGADSAMSDRAAAIEAAAVEVAAQLAAKQRELNRRRREAAVAAKAVLVEQMKASIAEIDTEILVGFHLTSSLVIWRGRLMVY